MKLSAVIFLLLFSPVLSLAHHSPAAYDAQRVVVFEGTVLEFDWRNPHVYFVIQDDNNVEWVVETDATPVLSRSGWTPVSFATGDEVIVRAHPHKNSEKTEGLLLSIEGPDGESMASLNRVPESGNALPVASATDFSGTWQGVLLPATNPIRIPLIASFFGLSVTEKGAAAKAEFDQSMLPVADCIAESSPLILALTSLYLAEFELREEVIVFRNELYDAERIIYLDGRDHPTDGERTNQGHSIGWWEGETLVVDTVNFADHRSPYIAGIPSGAEKHVVEKYTLSEDRTQMLIDVYVEDPEYLAEPFTRSLVWNYSPHLEKLSIDCDPDVARRFTQ